MIKVRPTGDALLGPVVDADAVVGSVQDLLLGSPAIEDALAAALFTGHREVSETIPLAALL